MTLFLACLAAFPPIATDMALPALSSIGESLDADVSSVTLTLGLFMLGYALAPLLAGPFSDSVGRRRTLLLGGAVYTAASLICVLAQHVEVLLIARVFQGAGAGACSVLALTIVRDLFDGSAAQRKVSQINAVMGMAPVLAPGMGSLLLEYANWRAIYAFMTLVGVLVMLTVIFAFQESSSGQRPAFRLATIMKGYASILSNRVCRMHIAAFALSFGSLFAYITASPHVLMNVLGVSSAQYGFLFAISALGLGAGAGVSGFMASRNWPGARILKLGLGLLLSADLGLFLLALIEAITLYNLMALIILSTFSFGMIAPIASHAALQPLPALAGSAAGLLGFSQMLLGFLASVCVALFLNQLGTLAMSVVMLVSAMWALAIFGSMGPGDEAGIAGSELPSALEEAA